ncbi:ABC transporter substrate-binding protein [Microlunatus capsulatus]|uniref:Raffinose/stachyose/melibiose transport system substrate-binding protein n=1 Tax=Microlunatus capsulatus TaxID=99117 RepID=A0ABS4Z8V5_9ACTN|nr:extracellular solute-binding protein [Microlunatus capsulatus]MBP2417483.1 raffinose/stachyose/melibiose transport system substrate-binding protein [Microlunatus capsulatus]
MAARRPLLVLVPALALTLTACFGGSPAAEESAAPQVSSGPVEIRYLVGQPEDAADLKLMKEDIAAFEAQSGGITVKLDVLPSETIRTVLQTQLRSGNGPDVFGYDTGPGFAGALAKAGLVHDLTGAYEKYQWPVYDFAKQRVTFDGKLVGIPSQMEEVGLFYNKDLFAQNGLAEPTDLADLMASATKLEQAGVIPFGVSDKEGWQGGHLLSMALSSEVGSDGMDKLLAGETPWTDPAVVGALRTWSDMAQQGLLTPSPTAVGYDNGNALFYSGKAAINPTGSWLAQDIERNAKFEVGFIPFPASGGPGIFSGGLGSGTFISAGSKKLDAAEKFLDYGMTAEHGRWAVENLQDIPAFPIDTSGIEASPLFTQILADTAKIADGSGDFGYNIDVLTNDTFNNAMWKGMQGLMTGQSTPEKVAEQLQKNFKKPAS